MHNIQRKKLANISIYHCFFCIIIEQVEKKNIQIKQKFNQNSLAPLMAADASARGNCLNCQN